MCVCVCVCTQRDRDNNVQVKESHVRGVAEGVTEGVAESTAKVVAESVAGGVAGLWLRCGWGYGWRFQWQFSLESGVRGWESTGEKRGKGHFGEARRSHIVVTDMGKSKHRADEWFWIGNQNPDQLECAVPGLEVQVALCLR